MRLDRPVALAAGALGILAGVLAAIGQFLPALLGVSTPAGAGPATFALSAVSLVVSPVLVLVVGYRAGDRLDVARRYRAVALSFAAGGALGYLPGYAVAVLLVRPGGAGEFAVLLVGSAAWNALVKAGWFAIAGVAGAAVGQFRHDDGDGPAASAGPA